jgi:DnaJ-class molecular chaperone
MSITCSKCDGSSVDKDGSLCSRCDGVGWEPNGKAWENCNTCYGNGIVEIFCKDGSSYWTTCSNCEGRLSFTIAQFGGGYPAPPTKRVR